MVILYNACNANINLIIIQQSHIVYRRKTAKTILAVGKSATSYKNCGGGVKRRRILFGGKYNLVHVRYELNRWFVYLKT